jgi:hypothetical protein
MAGNVEAIDFNFSDYFTLTVDDQTIFADSNVYKSDHN